MSSSRSSVTLRLAGFMGFLGVSLGAFGAHLLKAALASRGTTAIWEKAVLYHLVHAVVLLALGLSGRPVHRWVPRLFTVGMVLFSGSLYALSFVENKALGPLTPLGGACLLAGWAMLVITARDEGAPSNQT